MSAKFLVESRYAATTVDPEVLTQAGWVSRRVPELAVGLMLLRLRTGDRSAFPALVIAATAWIKHRTRGRYPGARRLAAQGLEWWARPTCPKCEGRAHPLVPDAQRLNVRRQCHLCRGTGQRPLECDDAALACWLVEQLDRKVDLVLAAMARKG